MGLIRKTAAVFTVGIIKPSSKKQRVAKKTLKAERRQANALEQIARQTRDDR